MTAKDKPQTEGREDNAAQPLGQRHGTVSNRDAERTAREERKSAGPDGPNASVAGDAAKGKKLH
jgi:hypothetical protein